METTDVVMQARNWAITHIEEMAKNESVDQIYDRLAMMDEWYEWFDLDKMDGMDYINEWMNGWMRKMKWVR